MWQMHVSAFWIKHCMQMAPTAQNLETLKKALRCRLLGKTATSLATRTLFSVTWHMSKSRFRESMYSWERESEKTNKGCICFKDHFFKEREDDFARSKQNRAVRRSASVTADTDGGKVKAIGENVATFLHSGLNYASRIINGRTWYGEEGNRKGGQLC